MVASKVEHEDSGLLYFTEPETIAPQLEQTSQPTSTLSRSEIIFNGAHSSTLDLEPVLLPNNDKRTLVTSREVVKSWNRRDYIQCLHSWGWEFAACLGSLVTFMIMIGTLCAYDGNPQPEWPYGITLNSAISWLTTLSKSLLLVPAASCINQSVWINYSARSHDLYTMSVYDSASRGPWGALQLLWTLRARSVTGLFDFYASGRSCM
jgi:hypothetical protein